MQSKISIENLKSLFYQLEYINSLLERAIETQTIKAEDELIEKTNDLNKLRENNLNMTSKLINMNNIIKIEEFFSFNYNKILNLLPKLNTLCENLNEIKPNINYALDKLYLDDHIVCDENLLKNNLQMSSSLIENVTDDHAHKNLTAEEIKLNYTKLKNLIENQKKKFAKAKMLLDKLTEINVKSQRQGSSQNAYSSTKHDK